MWKQKINPEIKFILFSSRTKATPDIESAIKKLTDGYLDWEKIFKLSKLYGTASLVYNTINNLGDGFKEVVPHAVFLDFKSCYYSVLDKNLRRWQEFLDIFDAFNKKGIQIIPLKGIMLGNFLYNNPGLRLVPADIDILIKANDVPSANKILKNMGYNLTPEGDLHINAFRNERVMLEVHWLLLPPWLNRIKTENLWKNSVIRIQDNRKIRTLSYEDTLLTLPLQIRHDLPILQFFRLCDINEILTQYEASLNWNYILKACKEYKISWVLYGVLSLCHAIFPSPLPKNMLKQIVNNPIKRKLLFLLLEENLESTLNNTLVYKKAKFKTTFLKSLMIDGISEYFKRLMHKNGNI